MSDKLTRGRIIVVLILLVIFALGGPIGIVLWFLGLVMLSLYVSISAFVACLVVWACVHMWRFGL